MSRHIRYFGEHLLLITGEDKVVGKFIQVADNRVTTDPSGEGYVFDWCELFGVAYSDVYWDIKAEKKSNLGFTEDDPQTTVEEAMAFIQRTYIKDEQERFPTKNTESTHNGENPDTGSNGNL